MSDYIKRSDATSLLVSRLQETAQNNAGYQCDAGVVYADAADRLRLAWINDIPAADVVERKRGEWMRVNPKSTVLTYRCSECGFYAHANPTNFCPNCGAMMEVDDET